MTPESEEKMSGFARGEAKPVLDAIMRRYGIHPFGRRGEEDRTIAQPDAPKVETKKLSPGPRTSLPATSYKQFSLVPPPSNFDGRYYSSQPPAMESVRSTKKAAHEPASDRGFAPARTQLLKERDEFHFLVRILECSVILHCQVSAESATDAKDQVQRIPNLLEWRETSLKEIAEFARTESS